MPSWVCQWKSKSSMGAWRIHLFPVVREKRLLRPELAHISCYTPISHSAKNSIKRMSILIFVATRLLAETLFSLPLTLLYVEPTCQNTLTNWKPGMFSGHTVSLCCWPIKKEGGYQGKTEFLPQSKGSENHIWIRKFSMASSGTPCTITSSVTNYKDILTTTAHRICKFYENCLRNLKTLIKMRRV